MRLRKLFCVLWLLAGAHVSAFAQLSIQYVGFNAEDVGNTIVNNISLLNTGNVQSAVLDIKLYNSSRQKLMHITTAPVSLKQGQNMIGRSTLNVTSVFYDASDAGNYLKTFRKLSSGNYSVCVIANEYGNAEQHASDEYCDELSVEHDFNLSLVSPLDNDEIETSHPVLIWTHNEPFSMNSGGEDYRILLAELLPGQSPASAIVSNNILFNRNNLRTHTVVYPANVPKLEAGKKYCWKIEKISNGRVVNQTDVWTFTVIPDKKNVDVKYGVLAKDVNASYYQIGNGKIFFRFTESYASKGELKIRLTDEMNHEVKPKAVNEARANDGINYKVRGGNAFEIDVDDLHLKAGFYLLEVINEKQEKFLLKCKVD